MSRKRPAFEDDPIGYLDYEMERTYLLEPDQMELPRSKRTRNKGAGGGGRRHPNSMAALAAHRARTQLGSPHRKTCKHCNRVAVKGLDVCFFHGGGTVVQARKRAKGLPIGSRSRIAGRRVAKLIECGKLPQELIQHPVFQTAWAAGRGKMKAEEAGPALVRFRRAAILLAFEAVRAWFLRERGEHAAWVECVRKSRELGLTG